MYNELTESDIRKMQEEIDQRKLVIRKELLEAVKDARAQGDLSENFEYYAAKREKNRNESRIRYLDRMIRTAVVISEQSEADCVGLNNTVELYFEEEGITEQHRIVTTVRGNSLKGLISNVSPLGKAVMGGKVGDRIYVEIAPGRGYHVVIKSIDKTSGDEDDKIRGF